MASASAPYDDIILTQRHVTKQPDPLEEKKLDTVDTESEEGEKEREKWGTQLEFILTCVGYAVGLGNVWRFPYLCFKNGGGAFLVPYFIMLALCGMPVFFFEVLFGQFGSLGPLAIWKVNPLFKGIGWGMVTVSFFVGLYYNILVAYILFYFFASMNTVLPWNDCENHWNTYKCLTTDEVYNKTYLNWYLEEHNMTNEDIRTPSEEYYYLEVLKISDGIETLGNVVWQLALCLLLCWTVVFLVLIKGIGSLGKVVYFTSTFPYLMMTIMVIRGCTLEGAGIGMEYYLKPDWSRLSDSEVWTDAASQIFYTLSTCSGGLIAMASYNTFKNNAYRDSILIPLINCFTSLYSGVAIFTVLGFLAVSKDVGVEDVAASGPGLIFVVYPEGLSQMPGSVIWSLLFFFMMLTLGFSSQFSIVECIFTAVLDKVPFLSMTPTRPAIFRAVCCCAFFLLSLPMVTEGGFYLFTIMDEYAGGLPRLFTGLFELIAVIWVYGLRRYMEDIAMMLGHKPNYYFRACWTVISPSIVIFILLFKAIDHSGLTLFNDAYVYPTWANAFGWLLVCTVVVWIPIMWVVQWFKYGGYQVLKAAASPTPEWGPALEVNRTGRYKAEQIQQQHEEAEKEIMKRAGSTAAIYKLGQANSVYYTPSPGSSRPSTSQEGSVGATETTKQQEVTETKDEIFFF